MSAVSHIAGLAIEFGGPLKAEDESERYVVVSRDIEQYLGWWSLASLVVLASLAFPHENSSCYPRLPIENRIAIDTVELGCDDYNDDLGIVKHIGYFGYVTGLVLNDMKVMLELTARFFAVKRPAPNPHNAKERS